jgi:hypothetical protein
MIELVHFARGKEIHLGFNVNEETMEGNDVDDQLPQAPSCVCPIATTFASLWSFQLWM